MVVCSQCEYLLWRFQNNSFLLCQSDEWFFLCIDLWLFFFEFYVGLARGIAIFSAISKQLPQIRICLVDGANDTQLISCNTHKIERHFSSRIIPAIRAKYSICFTGCLYLLQERKEAGKRGRKPGRKSAADKVDMKAKLGKLPLAMWYEVTFKTLTIFVN